MTKFLAEGNRLGITHTSQSYPGGAYIPATYGAKDDEGLCVTGCDSCREFRNKVRAALAAEERRLTDELDRWVAQFEDIEPFDFEDDEPEDEPTYTQGDVDLAYRSGVLDALRAVRKDLDNQYDYILGDLDRVIDKREENLYA